ncbi:hypothetical protein UFOVP824_29 [uncultured Caudovirales phage]|uniref:Uncharacterized protein n=1 Tax=uncultured Caudovirales phage TaxID=2100421 RepID=A0A6J5NZV0_9CAUD|nr:hypothetical protein UFOVP824_29 [uncultured Caudovirales phage]
MPVLHEYIDPVALVLEVFGGVCAVARIVGRDPSAVSKWQDRRRIPTSCQAALLDAAHHQGLALTADEVIRGRRTQRESDAI